LAKADEVADSFGRTAESVNEAATAWNKAAEATNLALKEFSRIKPARKDPNSKASFNIDDYRDTIETAAVTVDGLRTLTAEVREFAKSDELATCAFAIHGLFDHVAWRVALLFLFAFILTIAYRIVVIRIVHRREQNR
jgi:cell division protein FtsX